MQEAFGLVDLSESIERKGMNINPHDKTDSDNGPCPPDPVAARSAASEARRMLVASYGSGMMVLGGMLLCMMVVRMLSQIGCIGGQRISGLLLILMGPALLLVGFWARHIRRSHGVFAELKGESANGGRLSRKSIVAVVAGAILGGGVVSQVLFCAEEAWQSGTAWLFPLLCLGVAVVVLWRAVYSRLWEFFMASAGFVLSGTLFVLVSKAQDWIGFIPMALGIFVTGLLLHLRWRRWVNRLSLSAHVGTESEEESR
jgi:hypothetical protein